MAIPKLSQFLLDHYEVHEWRHASAILAVDFPGELADIENVLSRFRLYRSKVIAPGGSKSEVSGWIDGELSALGWQEKKFQTQIRVDDAVMDSPTHKVDCFKNRVALEIEWNNKDPFFDRDLNNFRLLFELRAISVGVIVTRCSELQQAIFNPLGKGSSYGNSTTHMSKLLSRIQGGGGGGCPILVLGISERLYVED